jgi:hypothetical protein
VLPGLPWQVEKPSKFSTRMSALLSDFLLEYLRLCSFCTRVLPDYVNMSLARPWCDACGLTKRPFSATQPFNVLNTVSELFNSRSSRHWLPLHSHEGPC